jgi:hypothetical protein
MRGHRQYATALGSAHAKPRQRLVAAASLVLAVVAVVALVHSQLQGAGPFNRGSEPAGSQHDDVTHAAVGATDGAVAFRQRRVFMLPVQPASLSPAVARTHPLPLYVLDGVPLAGCAAIALLFHGCSHSGEIWAAGSAEHEVLTHMEARRVFAVALSSAANARPGSARCWDSSEDADNPDVAATMAVASALTHAWREANPRTGAAQGVGPRFVAMGASSGGSFTSLLAGLLRLEAAAVYIMGLRLRPAGEALLVAHQAGAAGHTSVPELAHGVDAWLQPAAFPRIAFVHMPVDARTARNVAIAAKMLQRGQPAEFARTRDGSSDATSGRLLEARVMPQPVYGDLFYDRMPWLLTPRASRALVRELEINGWLTAIDPRAAIREAATHGWGLAGLLGSSFGSATPSDELDEQQQPHTVLESGPAAAYGVPRALISAPPCAAVDADKRPLPTNGQCMYLAVKARSTEVGALLDAFVDALTLVPVPGAAVRGEGTGLVVQGHTVHVFDLPAGYIGQSSQRQAAAGAASSTGNSAAAAGRRLLRRDVGEVLNEVEARHEMTGVFAAEVVRWLVGPED